MEVESVQPLKGRLASFYIDEALAVSGVHIADLPFPEAEAKQAPNLALPPVPFDFSKIKY